MAGVFAHWPNRITALRFAGAAALFVVLARYGDFEPSAAARHRTPMLVAFWLFLAVALSDILDGWLARRGNLITAFGRIADPFVDKVLVMGAMIFLVVLPWSREFFPPWLVVVVLSREFLVTGVRGYVESLGQAFPADWFGKIKMLVQCWAVAIPIGLVAFEMGDTARSFWRQLAWITVALTLITSVGSGFSYVYKARKLFAGGAR